MKHTWVCGFLLGITLSASYLPLARADVAPPDDYVEQCTVEKKQVTGLACVSCANDYRSFATDAGDPCALQYQPQGYTKNCKSWGASVWTEVWCKGQADAGSEVTAPTGGCSCRANAKQANGPFAGLLIVGALFATRILKRAVRKQRI